ncbi:MAG: FG-GAP-like repeat-containing protein [Candidatus Bathyarchaeia archaeon]
MKNIVFIALYLLCSLLFAFSSPKAIGSDTLNLRRLWTYPVIDNCAFAADMGDIDGDGFFDIGVLPFHWPSGPSTIQAVKSDGTPLWSCSVQVANGPTGVALKDIDFDGCSEVFIFGVTRQGGNQVIYSFDSNGDLLWQFLGTENAPWAEIDLVIFLNLDSDDHLEIFCGGVGWGDYTNYALDNDGTLLWTFTSRDIGSHMAVGDVNGDGVDEIVLFTFQEIYILSKSGALLTTIQPHTSSAWANGALGDIDGDGINEIVCSVYSYDVTHNFVNTLFVYNEDGTLLWQKSYLPNPEGTCTNPILVDLNGDGLQDIVVFANKVINAYKNDGTPLWTYTDIDPVPSHPESLHITNFDLLKGDGKDEILFECEEQLYILSLDGNLIQKVTMPNHGRWVGSGHVGKDPRTDNRFYEFGDVNNDGTNELIIDEVIDGQHWVTLMTYQAPALLTFSITKTDGGTTNPPPRVYTVPLGSECPVTAISDANYMFDHWELDGVNIGSSNPTKVTMDRDHSLHAVFTIISPPTYAVTIKAHCNTEGTDVTVRFWIDGSPTTYYTPYTFPSLTGTHTFTISTSDASGHQFKQWSTGATSHTITVSAGGTYTAYYEASPPTRYDVTINGYCITEATNINVEIIKDGVPTGFTTPHTFYGLTGTHTFTVPNADARKHKFKNWNTGHMSTTITVNSGATLTAYYEDQGNVIAGGIEAVQTIFDADLVQNKPTTFFITYKSTFVEEKKAYVRIELEGFDYAEWTFPVTFKPGQHDFWLHNEDLKAPDIKPTTTSTARCKVTLDVFNEITETREDDNIWPPSGTENYKVWDTKGLKVLFVKLHHVDEPIDKRITNVQLYRYMIEVKDFFLATYPVAPYEVTFEQSYEALLVEKGKNWAWVLTKLIANYGYGYDKVVGVASDWPGWNDPSRDLFDGGVGVSGSGNTKSVMVQNKYACSVAHEIGHTYNLGDDYFGGSAGDGAFECRHWSGYWVTKREPIIDAPTFMHDVPPFDSKGNPLPSYYYWIDNTDYALLLKKFCVSDPTVIIIGGIISRNGTIDPDNQFFRISIGQVDLENSTGDYYIVLLDESGQVLSKNGFNVTFICLSDPPIEVNESSFCYAVRWLDGTRIIQIQDAEGNILASKDISQNPPTVNVVSPNGNEVFTPGKNHTIEWFASDPDGDSLTYDIFISGSLDSTPVPIAIGLNQTSFTYDFADLPAGDRYLIYVFACDGVNVAYDVSDGFFSVSGFKIDVLTAPQTIANGAKAYYWLNLTSYEGFHGEVTLNVSTISGNLKFRWILGPVIIIPRNGSAIAIVEVEAVNSEGGNHTITITGISDNCKAEKTTHIYILSNDISLCNIVLSKHITEQGYILTINVTVSNQGSLGQNFNLSLYCNSTEIAYESVFLHAGSLATITFTWNTTNFVEGNYMVWAYAWPVQGETDTEDNAYMDGTVRILQTLSVSITPSTTEIKVGESITFISTVSGGLQPYSYWWFVNGTAVEGAISKSWTFMPTKPGTYIIHLNVTDSTPQTVKSNIAMVTVAPQLVASISPTSASILVGQSVTFTSTVSGGYTPYTYQWYLNGNPVSGATSATWTFTPTTAGMYYVHLKVTDAKGNTAQSDTARITVTTIPVGGYSIPIQIPTKAKPITPYIILTATLTIALITIKRKTTKKTKKPR